MRTVKDEHNERNATIYFESLSYTLLRILMDALRPETSQSATSRSKVSIEAQGRRLTLRIMAKDTSAFRATINSYLRWIALVQDTYLALRVLKGGDSEKTLN